MSKVSIIMPIYNAEKYLRECMDSVINQTMKDIEIICVNDGSKDSSMDILRYYESLDSRITIINKENEGAGQARNDGMRMATGDYLLFLDADDFFELDMVEKAYNSIEDNEADVCIFNGDKYNTESGKFEKKENLLRKKYVGDNKIINRELTDFYLITSPSVWNKLFRREFIKRENLYFDNSTWGNDMTFAYSAIAIADRISILDEKLVHYRVEGDNANIQSNTAIDPTCAIYAFEKIRKNLEDRELFEVVSDSFANVTLNHVCYHLRRFREERNLDAYRLLVEKLKNGYAEICGISELEEQNVKNKTKFQQFKTQVSNAKKISLQPKLTYVKMGRNSLKIGVKLNFDDNEEIINKDLLCIVLNKTLYKLVKKQGTLDEYEATIEYSSIKLSGNKAVVYLYEDNPRDIFLFETIKIDYSLCNKPFYSSKIKRLHDKCIFVYSSKNGNAHISFREKKKSDAIIELKKMAFARRMAKRKKYKNSIVLFEKKCEKYEESARIVFEKLIDLGYKDVYFILDEKGESNYIIPEKYRNNIVRKYSVKHYELFFSAKTFISTETMHHCIDTNIYSSSVKRRLSNHKYKYVFLGHGISGNFSLKGRSSFQKKAFGKNSLVVVSSDREAKEFINAAGFKQDDLIKSGVPKFDVALKDENADKITIMLTSRNYEYSTIRDNPTESDYYKMLKRIINNIPVELKEKVVVAPHPLLFNHLKNNKLGVQIVDNPNYDKLIQETELLITDFSSISWDAFYRGCNVVFVWTERADFIKKTGYDILLDDKNVFGYTAYEYNNLCEIVRQAYGAKHSDIAIKRFRDEVEFFDNKNTERLINELKIRGILQ